MIKHMNRINEVYTTDFFRIKNLPRFPVTTYCELLHRYARLIMKLRTNTNEQFNSEDYAMNIIVIAFLFRY